MELMNIMNDEYKRVTYLHFDDFMNDIDKLHWCEIFLLNKDIEKISKKVFTRLHINHNEIRSIEDYSPALNPNILNEGNQMKILDASKYVRTMDECDLIVRCNNCGQPTLYGETRMISGFVGCDNKILVDGKEIECYFDDLMPRVVKCHNSEDPTLYNIYRQGKVYRWRDGADGGIKNTKGKNKNEHRNKQEELSHSE